MLIKRSNTYETITAEETPNYHSFQVQITVRKFFATSHYPIFLLTYNVMSFIIAKNNTANGYVCENSSFVNEISKHAKVE